MAYRTGTPVALVTGPGPVAVATVREDDGDGNLIVQVRATGGYPQFTIGQHLTVTPGDVYRLTASDLADLGLRF